MSQESTYSDILLVFFRVLCIVFIRVSESLQEVSEYDKVVECHTIADGGPRGISEASSRHR